MARKTQEADDINEFGDLDDVAVKVVVKTIGGGGKVFPAKLVEVLKTKFDNDGSFALPKEWLEDKLGYDTSKPMKGRPNAIKRKLNTQHGDVVGDLHMWHVGNSDNNYYTISIFEVTEEVENKWKHPVRKTKELESVPSGDE